MVPSMIATSFSFPSPSYRIAEPVNTKDHLGVGYFLCALEMCLGIPIPPHSCPPKIGFRFSAKALIPSRKSAVLLLRAMS